MPERREYVCDLIKRLGFRAKKLPRSLSVLVVPLVHRWALLQGNPRCVKLQDDCDSLLESIGPNVWSRDSSRSEDLVQEIEAGSSYTEHLYFDNTEHRIL